MAASAWEVSPLTQADILSLSEMRAEAFSEKRPRCCCFGYLDAGPAQISRAVEVYGKYAKKYPAKFSRCAVVRGESGQVVGACQLQIGSDPGDMTLPFGMRHELQPGECYLEWIAVGDGARGKGVGTKLMDWAHATARQEGCRVISLEVMGTNRAAELYRRQGYVERPSPDGDDPFTLACTCCIVW
eukprot:CAMPEP_0177764166 /NCGR_PEP_ID=MMETSP0491_2-20121128/7257_1 /TAXON_ID=63592 /ORGANISM="Tetraselmis chuii, Strain PLY429" /LENGTH=185 /DNA_ID=CAMNT_0019280317 /DNA_START=226 /DNA_END=780 /DNA_ORIENTATION=+